jgi:diguanylate cyclase (GGDEF)-like protein/PAS domain S-box-containing protein
MKPMLDPLFVRSLGERKRLEQLVSQQTEALAVKETQLRAAISMNENILMSSPVGIAAYRKDGQCVLVNPALAEIVGGSCEQLLSQNYRQLASWREAGLCEAADGVLEDGLSIAYEAHLSTSFGREVWVHYQLSRFDNLGEPHLLIILQDHTAQKQSAQALAKRENELQRKDERIHHLAFHDVLTGLPNRALYQDRLQHALTRAQREEQRLAVIFIDLDRFKAVNDALGHDIGDMLLQEVAHRIKNRLRAMDTVARMGGDEFVVLMEDLKEAGHCASRAQELIGEIARPLQLRGHTVEIGASLGIAFFPEDGADPVELMKRADMAMYAAKAAGRNTYRFFQQDMLEKTSQRLALEMELRRAIAQQDLELHYQPKVALETGETLGVEALVRWRHPQRGLLPPKDFIPVAEESGLIVDIGSWVLNEACRQAAEWRTLGRDVKIAVNVSAKQLEACDLVERITALIAQHGITPGHLEIELTESTVMSNPDNVAQLFARLRALGITVAVDDFGTGYSSLAYLRRLPIDILKIDRSFVMEADRDDEDAQIVKTILALGQALKLKVVAEGIETSRQAELLRSFGCGMAQGFLFSQPLPPPQLELWMDNMALTG